MFPPRDRTQRILCQALSEITQNRKTMTSLGDSTVHDTRYLYYASSEYQDPYPPKSTVTECNVHLRVRFGCEFLQKERFSHLQEQLAQHP